MSRISSAKYLTGSRGQQCTLRIPGICNGLTETTVPAHIRDGHKGTGNKASDLSVCNACSACHDALDGRSIVLSREDWLFYALRGLQETLEQRHAAGLLIIPLDHPKARAVAVRKPKEARKPIPQPKNHKWPSRPFGRRKHAPERAED